MFKTIFLVLYLAISLSLQGQYLNNPSFEAMTGTYSDGSTLPGWSICVSDPEIQPGYYCIKQPASNGNTYICFGSLSGTTTFGGESVGQYLQDSLKKGLSYTFSADLADTDSIYAKNGQNLLPNQPCLVPISLQGSILKVYASSVAKCGFATKSKPTSGTLIWQSDTVRTTTWKTYSGTFVPDSNYRFIRLEVISRNCRTGGCAQDTVGVPNSKISYLVYLKVDNLKLYTGTITSLINGDQNPQTNTPPQLSIFDRLGKWVRLVFD